MKYAIWNKKDPIYTPSGAKYTAEQWIAKHPIAENPNVTIICADGEFNGAVFATLRQLEESYAEQVDFSVYTTAQKKVEAVNAYIAQQNALAKEAALAKAQEVTAEERIAAALEYQVMASLPDVDEEEEA